MIHNMKDYLINNLAVKFTGMGGGIDETRMVGCEYLLKLGDRYIGLIILCLLCVSLKFFIKNLF